MIYWYEHLCDDPDFDIHEYIIETGQFTFNSNVSDNFVFLAEKLNDTLSTNLSLSDIENFNLYDHQKLQFVERKVRGLNSPTLSKYLIKMIKEGRSFRIPRSKNYYCSSYSINRLAFLAGVHLYLQVMNRKKLTNYDVLLKSRVTKKFIFLCYQSFIGYFSSKMINPYRKCDRYQDFSLGLKKKNTTKLERSILKKSKQILDLKLPIKEILRSTDLFEVSLIARKTGYLLADLFFENIFEKEPEKEKAILNTIFSYQFCEKESAEIIISLLPRKTYKQTKKTFF